VAIESLDDVGLTISFGIVDLLCDGSILGIFITLLFLVFVR
jgi:hypothetical protein